MPLARVFAHSIRSQENPVLSFNRHPGAWSACASRFWEHKWYRRCDERLPPQPGPDAAASVRIPRPSADIHWAGGRSEADLRARRLERLLSGTCPHPSQGTAIASTFGISELMRPCRLCRLSPSPMSCTRTASGGKLKPIYWNELY